MSQISEAQLQCVYSHRFSQAELLRRRAIWRVLCQDFFQRYVPEESTLLDLGAGYCEFINQIKAARKIAVDLNPDTARFAAPDVTVYQTSGLQLAPIGDQVVDVVFCSNFFEHLESKREVLGTMMQVDRVLRPRGRFLILQPNIRYTGGAYWDFFDHHLAFTDASMTEALVSVGFTVIHVRPRFLPYTTKSRLPTSPALVRWYLRLPFAQRLLGAQMFIVAEKGNSRP